MYGSIFDGFSCLGIVVYQLGMMSTTLNLPSYYLSERKLICFLQFYSKPQVFYP